jgi:hypothetical protein
MPNSPETKIYCLEQRVDTITREFVDELRQTNRLLEGLTEKVQELENERIAAKSFLAGIVFLATGIGGFAAWLLEHVASWRW